MTGLEQEIARDAFREAMLDAMDRHFAAIAGGDAYAGPRDADLPELFRALDRQLDLCLARMGLIDPDA